MKQYYISLEPEEKLSKRIKRVKKRFKGEQYANDPPHITICVFDRNLAQVIDSLNDCTFPKINFKIICWRIYVNDILTKKETLTTDVNDLSRKLDLIYVVVSATIDKYAENLYPFKNKDWEPNIKIAAGNILKDLT